MSAKAFLQLALTCGCGIQIVFQCVSFKFTSVQSDVTQRLQTTRTLLLYSASVLDDPLNSSDIMSRFGLKTFDRVALAIE